MGQPLSSTESLQVDVVVIGGGIQGLWLLADLKEAGYQAILLERMQPGFGQTGHSHVFLHEGHMYASMLKEKPQDTQLRVTNVLKANSIWKTELLGGRLQDLKPLKSDFYIGWKEPDRAEDFEDQCRRVTLPCDDVSPRPAEFGHLAQKIYKAEGICLESRLLLENLLRFRDLSQRVGRSEIIDVEANPSGDFRFVARRDKQTVLQINASAVVLSAGSGNEKLVKRLFGKAIPVNSLGIRQQTVKTFMLVLRQINDSLPLATGMYPEFGGIFMVSRKDSDGRTVWLIGDRQRKLVAVPGEITAFDAVTWFKTLRLELEKLFPGIVNNADNYEWGIYEATKAEPWTENQRQEGGTFPGGYHVLKLPSSPIWLTWPTLLTFAPIVANSIVTDLIKSVKPGSFQTDWSVWENFREGLNPDDCRWKTTPLLSWTDFARCFAPL